MAEEKPQVPISALPEFKSNPDGFFVPGYKGTQPTSKADLGKMIDQKTKQALAQTQQQVADINRDMGKYQQLPDVTLTLVESGRRIDKDGKFVADTNWNIGRLGAVGKGNIYELLMGGSDKMVLGTALFVSHTVERIGGADTDVYTPIFSAVNVDLPISTYAVLLAGEDYADVLVSYRSDVAGANTMRVSRWGIFASIATQLANLKKNVDLKSFADGYYKNMRTGNADALTIGSTAPVYNETLGGRQVNNAPEMMGTRDAASTNSTSSISVQKVAGVSCGGNQMCTNNDFSKTISELRITQYASTLKTADGILTITPTIAVSNPNDVRADNFKYRFEDNHKVLYLIVARGPIGKIARNCNGKNYTGATVTFSKEYEWESAGCVTVTVKITGGWVGITSDADLKPVDVLYSQNLDLTTLFPSDSTFVDSLGTNDAPKVLNRLSFFAYNRDAQNNVTRLDDELLQKGAEVIAKMGYVEPKFVWAGVGRYNLVDGNTGRIKQSIDKISQKTAAWNKALAVLAERGIAIPDFAQKPIEFGIDDNVCVKWTNDHLEVNCWMVELGSLTDWRFNTPASSEYANSFSTSQIKGIKLQERGSSFVGTMVGYSCGNNYRESYLADKLMSLSDGSLPFSFANKDMSESDIVGGKIAKLQGQYLVYQLAEPIFIPLDEPMNINFVDAKPYDLYTLDDMDGEPMYEVEVTPNEDGTYHTIVAPKAEWVEQHKSLPITIGATLAGIGTNVGYDFIMALEQRVRNLENK